jgi:hypothetical protein
MGNKNDTSTQNGAPQARRSHEPGALSAPHDLFGGNDEAPSAPPPEEQTPAARTPLCTEGQFACAICGAPAHFGFDVKLRAGRLGRWSCAAHRDDVKINHQ